jgi:hypothetical protein
MSSKQHNRRGYQQRQSRKPQAENQIKGSAFKGDLGPAFQMLMERLDQTDQQVRLLAQAVSGMKETDDARRSVLEEQYRKDKAASLDGLRAAREGLIKVTETTPMDEGIRQQYVQEEIAKARRELATSQADFENFVRDAPTGEVISFEPDVKPVMINGVTFVIRPGINKRVPMPFIQVWEEREEIKKYVAARAAEIAGVHEYGAVLAWRDSQREAAVS